MSNVVEYTYDGHSNTIDLLLKADGTAVDLTSVTRARLTDDENSVDIDSDEASGVFDWTHATTGKITIALGGQSLTVGETYTVRLIIYDPTNTDGLVWGEFLLRVK